MKKVTLTLSALVLLGSLVACNNLDSSKNNNGLTTTNTNTVMNYQLIESTNLLDNNIQTQASLKLLDTSSNTFESSSSSDTSGSSSTATDLDINEVLNEADFTLSIFNNLDVKTEESDKKEYQSKEVISYTNIDDSKKEVVVYYNIEKEEEKDDDEVEIEEKITGIILDSEKEYSFVTTKENEKEGNEEEIEVHTIVKLSDKCYIESKREFEQEGDEKEEKFTYTEYKDGNKVSTYSYNLEKEDNTEVIKIKKNNVTYKLVSYRQNNKEYIKVTKINGKEKVESTYEKVVDEKGNISFVKVK